MGYTNSSIVSYTNMSPNHSGQRTHIIDTISPHCVVGQLSVESIGKVFEKSSRQASSNYGIGYDGRVGLYVPEAYRSWCTSSNANDQRAITIEVASDKTHPYAINSAAYKSLIVLMADICKRNSIKKMIWSTDKNTRMNHLNGSNITVHRDYAAKACPGDYMYSRMGQIALEVNKLLGNVDNGGNNMASNGIQVGDTVEFKSNAVQWNGNAIPAAYKKKVYTVKQIDSNGRTVLTINGTVMYAVDVKYLTEVVSEIMDPNTPSSWAKASWEKLKAKGATDGTNPTSTATREQVAVMLDRLGLLD